MKPPDIVRHEGFLVMGTVTRRQPGTERPETTVTAWNEFETHRQRVQRHSVNSKYYGVSFAAGADGSFDYLTGMAVRPGAETPEGLEIRAVPAATCAVFTCPVQSIGQTYRYIFGEWRAKSGYLTDDAAPAFEEYPPATDTNAPVLLYIPIREDHAKRRRANPMNYKLTIHQKSGFLHAIVTGQNSKETAARYLQEVLGECIARCCCRVLIEERLEGPRLGTLDVFDVASQGSKLAAGKLKAIAYVDLNAESDSMQFAENVAVNRGLPVAVFPTVTAAEAWMAQLNRGGTVPVAAPISSPATQPGDSKATERSLSASARASAP